MLTDGLVEFWTLNGSLVGINGNTLVSADGLEHYVEGKIGQGWSVNNLAANTLILPDAGPLILARPAGLTYACWFRWTGGAVNVTRKLMWGGAATVPIGLGVQLKTTTAGAVYSQAVVPADDMPIEISVLLADGLTGWHHAAVAVSGTPGSGVIQANLWIDGVLASQELEDFGDWSFDGLAGSPIGIGCTGLRGLIFRGDVDACGIWDRAISDAEAIELYNSGLGWEPSVSSVVTNILHGSTPETSRILRSRIVQGVV